MPRITTAGTCSFEGCRNARHNRGLLCSGHASQRSRGTPLIPLHTAWGLKAAKREEYDLPRVDVPDGSGCEVCGLRGEHQCMGPAWAYARSGEAAGG